MNLTEQYEQLPLFAKVILQFFLGWPISCIYRLLRYTETKNQTTLIVGLLCIFIGGFFWIIDLIAELLTGRINVLAD